MITIGIDIGSSFIKAAVFLLEEGQLLDCRTFPAQARKQTEDSRLFELPAAPILAAVRGLIDEAEARWPLDGILLSTQMHGFVYHTADRPDTYISWQDSRCTIPLPGKGRTALEELGELLPPELRADCGVPLKPSLGLCNLYALLYGENAPAMGGELFTLGSYLIHGLGGKNICHITNAGPLGLCDVRRRRWHREVLEQAGLAELRLPELAEADFVVCGAYHAPSGRDIPLFPDYGDQQVCVLGAAAPKGYGVVNVATASQVSCNTPEYHPGPYEIRPYFENTYLNTISNMPGGRNLAVLVDLFRDCARVLCGRELTDGEAWSAISKQTTTEDTGLVVDTLFWPTGDRLEGGGISGIRPGSLTVAALLTAAYRDMAEEYARHIPLVCGGKLPDGLVFSGGVSWKNQSVLDAAAAATGLPCRRSALPDEAFGGLYRLSLRAMGIIDSLGDATGRQLCPIIKGSVSRE